MARFFICRDRGSTSKPCCEPRYRPEPNAEPAAPPAPIVRICRGRFTFRAYRLDATETRIRAGRAELHRLTWRGRGKIAAHKHAY